VDNTSDGRPALKLPGHSGCLLELVAAKDGTATYVRKSTKDPAYRDRLLRQGRKQQAFAARLALRGFAAPRIVDAGAAEDSAYLLMEYCGAADFIDYLEDAGVERLDALCRRLIGFIEENVKESASLPLDRDAVHGKIASIRKALHRQPLLSESDRSRLEALLAAEAKALTDWELPVGPCHGDFTLSNMLFDVDRDRIVLVDFLDSFLESPLQDLVKLRQDTKHHWSLWLVPQRRCDRVRLELALGYIDRRIDAHFAQYAFYRHGYRLFQLINFARIVPYVKRKSIMELVLKTIFSM